MQRKQIDTNLAEADILPIHQAGMMAVMRSARRTIRLIFKESS
jgi:hypothetical protein